MSQIRRKEPIDLSKMHTFGLPATAEAYSFVECQRDLEEALELADGQFMILGGGSNVVFVDDYPGRIIHVGFRGIQVVDHNANHIWIKVAAGENWHELVEWCLSRGYGGLENLSLIPGTVGAAPIQNIGAYGVELQSVFEQLTAYHMAEQRSVVFTQADCQFNYRDSIFKQSLKGMVCIMDVTLKLTRTNHSINVEYGAIKEELQRMHVVSDPTLQQVSEAVIAIRSAKLPDPAELGNAGSFFKNPIVPAERAKELGGAFEAMPSFEVSDSLIKLPAAWLIQECGWKGARRGGVGVYEKHALVLVNHGKGKPKELKLLIQDIVDSVVEKFDIELEPEVNLIG